MVNRINRLSTNRIDPSLASALTGSNLGRRQQQQQMIRDELDQRNLLNQQILAIQQAQRQAAIARNRSRSSSSRRRPASTNQVLNAQRKQMALMEQQQRVFDPNLPLFENVSNQIAQQFAQGNTAAGLSLQKSLLDLQKSQISLQQQSEQLNPLEKKLLDRDISTIDELQNNANRFTSQLSTIDAIEQGLNELEAQGKSTGLVQDFTLPVRSALQSLGIDSIDVSTEEKVKTLMGQLALEELQKFKGSTSEKELAFAENTTLRFQNTMEGNRKIMQVGRAVMQRELAKNEFMSQFLRKNGTLNPQGAPSAQEAWDLFKELTPILIPNANGDNVDIDTNAIRDFGLFLDPSNVEAIRDKMGF